MLPRARRLDTRAFDRTFRAGRVCRHPLVHLRYYRRPPTESSGAYGLRAAFVAPKRLGPAVTRNRMRRRLAATLRLLWAEAGDPVQQCDLIWLAQAPALAATARELQDAMGHLLREAGRRLPPSENGKA